MEEDRKVTQPYLEFTEDLKEEMILAMSLIINRSWWMSKEKE